MRFLNYYKFLGITDPQNATCKVVQKAYRKKALELHPDKLTDPEQIKQAPALISEMEKAKDILCDPCKKLKYDDELRQNNKPETDIPDISNFDEATNISATDISASEKVKIPADIAEQLKNFFRQFNENTSVGSVFEIDGEKPENFNEQTKFHTHVNGNTFLHLAILYGKTEIAKDIILSCSDDKDSENILGYTPLHYAAIEGYDEIVNLLLEYGIKITKNHYNETPLDNALQSGHVKIANAILSNVGDISEFELNSLVPLAKVACNEIDSPECKELYSALGIERSYGEDLFLLELAGESNGSIY